MLNSKEILNTLLTEFQTDMSGLAALLGCHRSTLNHIKTGHTKVFSTSLAKKVVHIRPEINIDFLLGKSAVFKLSKDLEDTFLYTQGRDRIDMDEIIDHCLKHLEQFEDHRIVKLYRNSIFQQGRASAFEEKSKK